MSDRERLSSRPTELLVEVQLPESKEGTGSAFLKVVRVAADPAKLNVAVAIEREKDICRDCRIALGSVAPKPFRTIEAEGILKGKRLTGTSSKRQVKGPPRRSSRSQISGRRSSIEGKSQK